MTVGVALDGVVGTKVPHVHVFQVVTGERLLGREKKRKKKKKKSYVRKTKRAGEGGGGSVSACSDINGLSRYIRQKRDRGGYRSTKREIEGGTERQRDGER